jgi:hypothetical protein
MGQPWDRSRRRTERERQRGRAPGPSIRSGRWTTKTSWLATRSALSRLPEPTTCALSTCRRPPKGLGAIEAGQLLGTRRLNSKLQGGEARRGRMTGGISVGSSSGEDDRRDTQDARIDALEELDALEPGHVGERKRALKSDVRLGWPALHGEPALGLERDGDVVDRPARSRHDRDEAPEHGLREGTVRRSTLRSAGPETDHRVRLTPPEPSLGWPPQLQSRSSKRRRGRTKTVSSARQRATELLVGLSAATDRTRCGR